MDNKRLIIGMLLAMGIIMGWSFFVGQMAKKYHWQQTPPAAQEAAAPQTPAAPAPVSVSAGDKSVPAPGMTAATENNGAMRVLTGVVTTQDTLLGSATKDDPTYSLGVVTTGKGAAINRVTLNEFRQANMGDSRYVFQEPAEGGFACLATEWIQINGQKIDLASANWSLVKSDTQTAEYVIEVGTDKKPLVRVHKRVQISAKVDANGVAKGGYEVLVHHSIENLADAPIAVELGVSGPTVPPKEVERGPDRYVIAGYNDDAAYPRINPIFWAVESMTGEKQTLKLTRSDKGWPVIWVGMASTYFDALVLPLGKDNRATAEFIEAVEAHAINPGAGPSTQANLLLQTKTLNVAAGQSTEFDLQAFFGPKSRAVLKGAYYGSYPRQYATTLTNTGSCSWCTFQWLVDAMVWLLGVLHFVLRDWGLAIIGLVLIVRSLLHPLTRKSTISMHRMQKLAPEMERLKKKYADNPTELNRAMMQFYKEHGAGQMLGCLPMFLQMPIWIALWSSLQSTFELRMAPFLWGYTWIHDLAKPDHLFTFAPIHIFFFTLDAVNILPILLGVVFWIQQKVTPKPPATTPEQEQQQKMMQWMVLLFPVMLYTGPAGLNLYILTSTTLGIIESKMIRRHIQAREAAEAAAGPVIIDAPVTRVSRKRSDDQRDQAPKTGIAAWLEKLQKLAEDAQKQQQAKRDKDKK